MWQFMPYRGQEYGLRRDRWVDEREDPVKATRAAALHLKDLYRMFGDWYLAMAAYNCGPGNVRKAVERTGHADFWRLRQLRALPKETMNYIPIILATALVAKDPQAYGFDVERRAPLPTDQVVVTAPTDLRLVAQLLNRPVEEIVRLNPGLLRWSTPPNVAEFALNLPGGTREQFEGAIAAVPPGKRVWWRAHYVADGETLAAVARKFRVSQASLVEANRLELGAPLEAGMRLLLPLSPGNRGALVRTNDGGPRVLYRYRIRSGDTLSTIAARFSLRIADIRRWNGLAGSRIYAGDTLEIYVRPEVAQSGVAGVIPRRTTLAGSSRASSSPAPGSGSAR
jgi:membrane-bound lytic murein transglycosylase D